MINYMNNQQHYDFFFFCVKLTKKVIYVLIIIEHILFKLYKVVSYISLQLYKNADCHQ